MGHLTSVIPLKLKRFTLLNRKYAILWKYKYIVYIKENLLYQNIQLQISSWIINWLSKAISVC